MDDRGDGYYCACDEGPWATEALAWGCRKCRAYLSGEDYYSRSIFLQDSLGTVKIENPERN